MDEADLRIVETVQCMQCGSSCEVKRAGDLLVAVCPSDGRRYVLTVKAPAEVGGETADPSVVGRTLGPCRIVAPVGIEGGLPVYQGLDVALGLPQAVRVISGEAARDKAQLQAFVRAGKLGAVVRHGALANVTHLGRFELCLYAVSAPLEGQPFDRALGEAGRLAPHDVVRVAARVAEALAALHARKIVHRNIGPKSLYLLPNGEPLLRNFAFAIGPGAPADPLEVVGQPGYMAPEQAAGGVADARADLYALGALLYLALVGRPVFSGLGPDELLRSQLAGAARAGDALYEAAPPGLADLVMGLLADAPQDRPAHARAVLAALRDPGLCTPAPPPPPGLAPQPAAPQLSLEGMELAVLEPEPPRAAQPDPPPSPAPKPRPAPIARETTSDWLDLSAEHPDGQERARIAPRPALGPRPAVQAPRPRAEAPEAAPVDLPGRTLDEFILESDKHSHEMHEPSIGPEESELEPPRPAARRRVLLAAAGGVIALLVVLWISGLLPRGGSTPPPPPPKEEGKEKVDAKKTLTPAERAEADAKTQLGGLEAFAKESTEKNPEEVIRRAEAFLEKHGKTSSAPAAAKLRDEAAAAVREKTAAAELAGLKNLLRDTRRPSLQRLADAEAFLKKHAGTKAVAEAEKLRDTLRTERETAAATAAAKLQTELDASLKAEAYGPALKLLEQFVAAHEGTKAGGAAAARLAELRQKVAAEFAERKAEAERLVRACTFRDAIAQFDAPLQTWKLDELKAEAEKLLGPIRERAARIVAAYGESLTNFGHLLSSWKLDEAVAAARDAAAGTDEPALRTLYEGKKADAEALFRVLDLAVQGAKAEQAEAAKGDGKVWIERTSGVRFKSTVDKPSRAGIEVDMPGLKGLVPWGEFAFEQLAVFARSSPGKPSATDHAALCIAALQHGASRIAYEEFEKAIAAEPTALEPLTAALRRHAQSFLYIPAGQFLAGQNRQARTLDGFLLAECETTNADYAIYLLATKAEAPPGWKEGRCPAGREEFPIVDLTWTEADAYARWLGMRLPGDQEWERAVRGTDGRLYPWGDKFEPTRANFARTGPKAGSSPLLPAHRHPFRRDDSPFYHLCGNVREWTETLVSPRGAPPAYSVVGGSAADTEREAPGYARHTQRADQRDPFTGLRLAWPR